MTSPGAWVLNFEVEREFAAPGYVPSEAVRERLSTLASELTGLLATDDVIVLPTTAASSAQGRTGFAWSPTPRALATLARSGASVPAAPALSTLMRVNSRRFSADLGKTLPNAHFVASEACLRAAVARPREGTWCLKEAFSTSGSGQRLVSPGELGEEDARWAVRALRHGVQVEPWVSRLGDFALHGHLSRGGTLVIGAPCLQVTTARGRWSESRLASESDLTSNERAALVRETERAAEALLTAGYFGPFNVDAFRYQDGTSPAFNPRCEVNARYTMGWAVGMNGRRPDRDP